MSHPKISHDGTHVNGSSSPPDLERFTLDDDSSPTYAGKGQQSQQATTSASAAGPQGGLITVQPLAKASLQPSYAQDLGTGSVRTYFLPRPCCCPSPSPPPVRASVSDRSDRPAPPAFIEIAC